MSEEKNMVEEYVLGIKKILALDAWNISIKWQGGDNNPGVLAVYDYDKHIVVLTISEALLESEDGVHNLFASIVRKLVGVVTGEVTNIVLRLEQQMQKIVLNAMKVNNPLMS